MSTLSVGTVPVIGNLWTVVPSRASVTVLFLLAPLEEFLLARVASKTNPPSS